MANLFLGWPNLIDLATLSGGSWRASLPLSYLQVRAHATIARSMDATTESTRFVAAFTAPRYVRAFGLFGTNLSTDATVRFVLGSTPFGSDVYDSGELDAWAISFGESPEWEAYAWHEAIAIDEYVGSPFPVLHVAPQAYSAQYASIIVDDETNAAGYVQMGRPFIGGGFSPELNPEYGGGLTEGIQPRSEIIRLESGGVASWARRPLRTVRIDLPYLGNEAEFPVVHELTRRASTHGEVLYVPDYEDDALAQRTGCLAQIARIGGFPHSVYGRRGVTLELVECV